MKQHEPIFLYLIFAISVILGTIGIFGLITDNRVYKNELERDGCTLIETTDTGNTTIRQRGHIYKEYRNVYKCREPYGNRVIFTSRMD